MKNKLNINDYENFLIIQTAFIGDVTLSLFFAEQLKNYNKNANITFITTKQSAPIVKCSKAVSNVIIFDKRDKNKGIKGIFTFAEQINQAGNYDIIFTLHRSFRSALLTKLIASKYKVGFDINSLSFLLTHKVKYHKYSHEVARNNQLFSIFNEFRDNADENKLINIEISTNDIAVANTLASYNEQEFIILAIGSVWKTKRWSVKYFTKLAIMLKQAGYEVILIGAESEVAECAKVVAESQSVSIAGKTTIPQTLAVIQNAKFVITNDSAPTHFASILNIPTVTIFGATSPIFGFSPLAEGSLIIEDNSLFCRPCSIHGQKKCPRKTHECMKNITPEMIFSKLFPDNN